MQIWQIYEHIYKNVYATISSNGMKKKIMIVIFLLIDISPDCDTPDRLVLLSLLSRHIGNLHLYSGEYTKGDT